MQTLNIRDLKSFLSFIAVDMSEPVMVWGPPGCGKSQSISQLTNEHRGVLVDIRLSQYDSVDLRGNPVPNHERQRTVWYAPETLPFVGNDAFPDDKPIILFLDEINSATNAVAAVAYQLINDRRVGEHILKDNVRVIAAGNREGDRGVTNRMPLPLANRFTHVEVLPDVDTVTEHFQAIGMPAVLTAFLQFRKPLLSTFDPAKPEKAFATPRTWEKVGHYYANEKMPEKVRRAACDGAVGSGPSTEFFAFIDTWQSIIPIAKIIADPANAPLPEAGGMEYAVAVNISGNMDMTNVKPLHQYLSRMRSEFLILAWQLAVKRDEQLYTTDEFMALASEYRAVFRG